MKSFINNLFKDNKISLNILLSLLFRGSSIIMQFLLVKFTLDYIKSDMYGVWITLTSFLSWIAIFDIGIANGLKNKLTSSLAVGDQKNAKEYVSTTYVIISIIAIILAFVFFICYQFVNWQVVFNSKFISENELKKVIGITMLFFLLKFISDIINVIVSAFQMTSIVSLITFLSNIILVIYIYNLDKNQTPDLFLLSFYYSFIPFLISLIANIYLLNKPYRIVKPSFKSINFKNSKGIVTLGSQFFIIQIVGLIIFQTDNILITHLFQPSEVTKFNVAYKYYSVVSIVFSIIMSPYWTAFSEAYHKNNFLWIKKTMKRLLRLWLISILLLLLLFIFSTTAIHIWIGDSVIISTSLSISICFYIGITNWNSIWASFQNGVGKIRLQLYSAILIGFLNIPIAFFLVKTCKFGTFAMPIANFISLLFSGILGFIQYNKIINKSAFGIWNR